MSPNSLTGSAGLKLGPLVLETLAKHYFERLKAIHRIPATTSSDGVVHDGKQGGSALNKNLRQEELLYDQAFAIVKVSCFTTLCDYPPLIRAILSFHHRVSALSNSCRLLLGK